MARLFDGVGFSALDALNYHADRLGRNSVVVMAGEIYKLIDRSKYPNIQIVCAEAPAEQGYIEKQAEMVKQKNLIVLNQALYGARALAPVGNKVVNRLEQMAISPDESFWVCASGSNLYGAGTKLAERFGCGITLVEPQDKRTIEPALNLHSPDEVKDWASRKVGNYNVTLTEVEKTLDTEDLPLHVKHPNAYLLRLLVITGNAAREGIASITRAVGVSHSERERVRDELLRLSPEYDWTGTTYTALSPAIESAKQGKNVVVMAYGRHRDFNQALS